MWTEMLRKREQEKAARIHYTDGGEDDQGEAPGSDRHPQVSI